MAPHEERIRGAEATLTPGVRRLGIILGLPLVDGVFVTLVLAGVLDSLAGILLVGAIVFAGSGAIAVILADLADDPAGHVHGVLVIGLLVIAVASMQAAIAPTIASLFDERLLTYFAALLLVVIGVRVGSRRLGHRLPGIGFVVLLGLLLSFRPNGITFDRAVDVEMAVAGGAAAGIGLVIAVSVLYLGARIVSMVDRQRFRYGGGAALIVLGIALVTPIPSYAPLLVLGVAFLLALNMRARGDPEIPATDGAQTETGIR